jgi:hypothetical protein
LKTLEDEMIKKFGDIPAARDAMTKLIPKRRTVLLSHWENGLYNHGVWECVGYSEYVGNGPHAVPRFAELQRKDNEDATQNSDLRNLSAAGDESSNTSV